ncbi:phage protein [Streptococcus pyogenes]|uniref:HeH/LEM domain-containing protein n=1 Tax=Streptococcus pyogenes TaxID=1314 RepID=UPI0010A0E47A|nr:HeH/LEM domain-containing protein [Streptococcus pyogenes]VHF95334.1 phage protein [Streptococcus pyogenes]
MPRVIRAFKDKVTKVVYEVGDIYSGDRVEFLTESGVLEPSVDFDKLKVSEIKSKLDELNVGYDAKLKKSDLLELLKQAVD